MDFHYATFWRWFHGNPEGALEPTDDIIVYSYHLDPDGLRVHHQGPQGASQPVVASRVSEEDQVHPFKQGRVNVFRVRDSDPLLRGPARSRFPNGLFAVLDSDAFIEPVDAATQVQLRQRRWRDNALAKKRMFLVWPTWHAEQRVLTADHFTFVVNHQGAPTAGDKRPLKFHVTTYPYISATEAFDRSEVKNYLPLSFTLQPDLDAFKREHLVPKLRGPLAPAIHSVLTRPFLPFLSAPTLHPGPDAIRQAVGGAKKRTSGRQRAMLAAQRLAAAGEAAAPAFAHMWWTLPLQQVHVIGVKRADRYHFTVNVRPRVSVAPAALTPATFFHLPLEDARSEQRVRAVVAIKLAEWSWDDFVMDWHDSEHQPKRNT